MISSGRLAAAAAATSRAIGSKRRPLADRPLFLYGGFVTATSSSRATTGVVGISGRLAVAVGLTVYVVVGRGTGRGKGTCTFTKLPANLSCTGKRRSVCGPDVGTEGWAALPRVVGPGPAAAF